MAETHPDFQAHMGERLHRMATAPSTIDPPPRNDISNFFDEWDYASHEESLRRLEGSRLGGWAAVTSVRRLTPAEATAECGGFVRFGAAAPGQPQTQITSITIEVGLPSQTAPAPAATAAPVTELNVGDPTPFEEQTNNAMYRQDHSVREAVLSVINAVVQDGELDPEEAIGQLEACKFSCEEAGVPFSELLSEDMEPAGVPPLMYEIIGLGEDPSLLEFLLENTPRRDIERIYRRACMARGDNDVFLGLRARLSAADDTELVPYDISVSEGTGNFHVDISIPNLPSLLERLRVDPEDRKRPLPRAIEWIAEDRIWSLEVTRDDMLVFGLIDGEAAHLSGIQLTLFPQLGGGGSEEEEEAPVARSSKILGDGRVRTVSTTSHCSLVPLSQAGRHTIVLPSLQSLGKPLPLEACCSDRGTLMIELDVALGSPKPAAADRKGKSVAQALDEEDWESAEGTEDWVTDEEEWEREEKPKEWVLASWSGRDADADE